jgi:hypothetical protein
MASEHHTVTSTQARRALRSAFKIKRPVFIWGPPGIGKSELVKQVAEDMQGVVVDIRMAQMEPTDLRGIPYYNREINKMDWAPPIDLPDQEFASKHKIVILFLDEFNSAAPSVQAAAYQLVLDRRCGKYHLPDNVVIVAAGNRESDKGVTFRMPLPLVNRFLHLEMRPDFASWHTWAIEHRIHKDVVGYLSFAKNDLCDFNSKSSSRAFPTPRTWTFVSQVISDEESDTDTQYSLIAGAIGEGLATKFMAHRKISDKMPNPMDILQGKVKTLQIKEISAMYSLTTSLCYELKDIADRREVSTEKFHEMGDNFFYFMMENFETELVVMGAKVSLKTYGIPLDPPRLKSYNDIFHKYGKYITQTK